MADINNFTFLLEFANETPNWKLISCAAIFGIIATMGIVLNCSVIYVTIRTKSLNGTVNYLLALCSFFEILHQYGHFLFVYVAFSGQNLIEYRLATKIIFIPAFGFGAIYTSMFFTGVDRLIVLIFGEIDGNFHSDVMITGCFVDFFMFASIFRILGLLLIIIMTLIVYFLVGIVIKLKSTGLPSADQINLRAFRALCCIITVNIGGYLICMLFVSLNTHFIPSPITAWFGQVITAILLNIGAASNGPILYFTSSEYRQAFRDEFPKIFKQNLNVIQVSPQQN
ncbi:hypothetical protein niasHS_003064 [Heterodera schachtii]|uniref:G-protein coupled receptors family 1 profile domain-containing protein n=1 Tax=Heterodera schachtii TaxID=97005 RepID=A0ABD2KAN9_HETSC